MLLNSALNISDSRNETGSDLLAVTGDAGRAVWGRESKRGVIGPFIAERKSIILF